MGTLEQDGQAGILVLTAVLCCAAHGSPDVVELVSLDLGTLSLDLGKAPVCKNKDSNWKCTQLKGKCAKTWVKGKCAKTCGECGGDAPAPAPGQAPAPGKAPVCTNKESLSTCIQKKERGDC